MSVFPTFSNGQKPDQTTWEEEREDPSDSSPIEGGYVVTRAKFTRLPRKTWRFEYKNVANVDKLAFDAFLDSVLVGSDAFTWNHPFTGSSYTVRFITTTNGRPPIVKYSHYHVNADSSVDHRWEITGIELQEV